MLNMNSYVIFNNISKGVSSNKYSRYTFELPNGSYYIRDTLPIRSFTKIEGNNSVIYFDPPTAKDLFVTPRDEMAAAYQISKGWNTQTIVLCEFDNLVIIGNLTRTSTTHAQNALMQQMHISGNGRMLLLNAFRMEFQSIRLIHRHGQMVPVSGTSMKMF